MQMILSCDEDDRDEMELLCDEIEMRWTCCI